MSQHKVAEDRTPPAGGVSPEDEEEAEEGVGVPLLNKQA